ncbi:MAG TPA: CoA-transferase [Solirubrobacteraceae bacterium]|jgi:glutaconate CoA-transferase subunit A|nr:CoA-transferase [Solirubrobacteraceae bacterium]
MSSDGDSAIVGSGLGAGREPRLAPVTEVAAGKRQSKLRPLEEALAAVSSGSTVGIGGIVHQSRPVAAVRELLRRELRELTVFSGPAAGFDVDLLIAAGAVDTLYVPAVTLEQHGMAPSFRHAVESGRVRAPGIDVLTLVAGYTASWLGVPFIPVDAWRGTDLTRQNPLASELPVPYSGTYAVAPIEVDVFVMHAAEADELGNVRSRSPMVTIDVLAAKAARHVVVVADELIEHDRVLEDPLATTLPAHRVDAICVTPYGAHPTSSPGRYAADDEHIGAYRRAAESARKGDGAALQEYLRTFVYEVADEDDYVARSGGAERFARLAREERAVT